MFGMSDTTLAGILGALVLGGMMFLGLRYDNQAIVGAAMGIVLPAVIAALGILSRSNAVSNAAHTESMAGIEAAKLAAEKLHDESLRKIWEAEEAARHGDAVVVAKVEQAVEQQVPTVAAMTATNVVKAVMEQERPK